MPSIVLGEAKTNNPKILDNSLTGEGSTGMLISVENGSAGIEGCIVEGQMVSNSPRRGGWEHVRDCSRQGST